jgi:hypothetical protein
MWETNNTSTGLCLGGRKGLEINDASWDIPIVITAKADDRKRVLVPQAKPGQVYALQDNGDGSVTLLPLKPDVKPRRPSILDDLKPFTKQEREQCWGPDADPEWDRIAEAMSKVPIPAPEE